MAWIQINYRESILISRLTQFLTILLTCAFLASCGGSGGDGGAPATTQEAADKLPQRIDVAEKSLSQLESAINAGQVRNALMIKEYARILGEQKPELKSLAENLSLDASKEGAIFGSLKNRLNTLKINPGVFESPIMQYQEANALIAASQPHTYNLALTDVINVLADMSNGSLPRIEAQAKSDSLANNNAQDMGAGSQLIGNPAYGQWTNQGGTSIWAWYGMYAMFRDLTGGRSYGYNQWNQNRDYSYYNDVGRNRYGNARTKTTNAPKTKRYGSKRDYGTSKKSYGSSSAERRASSYGKSKNKSSSFSKRSSNVGGSFRNKSTYSRSRFGGK